MEENQRRKGQTQGMKFTRWTFLIALAFIILCGILIQYEKSGDVFIAVMFLSGLAIEVARIDGYYQGIDKERNSK